MDARNWSAEEGSIAERTNPLGLPAEDTPVRYVIDAKGSAFTVQVYSVGLLSAFGHDPRIAVRNFQGDVTFTLAPDAIEDAQLTVNIQADSAEVVDDYSEKDRLEINRRMYHEVLETDRFPNISYSCVQVVANGSGNRFWIEMHGELTMHGVTRMLTVPARVAINGGSLRASGEFSVKQTDFGIEPISIGAGSIRVKNEIKCTFDILARQVE